MSKKREAAQKSHPEKVKHDKCTKTVVEIQFKARKNGKIIALDWLPESVKKLILAKIALFSLELETIVNRSKNGGVK